MILNQKCALIRLRLNYFYLILPCKDLPVEDLESPIKVFSYFQDLIGKDIDYYSSLLICFVDKLKSNKLRFKIHNSFNVNEQLPYYGICMDKSKKEERGSWYDVKFNYGKWFVISNSIVKNLDKYLESQL